MLLPLSPFQFTHPGKGATRPRLFGRGRHPCFNSRTLGRVRLSNHGSARRYSVSIHAPWEGCDLRWSRSFLNIGLVSIHAPWEGCDVRPRLRRLRLPVSIHAPWEGCDMSSTDKRGFELCFNSRTLGRVRLPLSRWRAIGWAFQFTHPGKGATDPPRRPCGAPRVSIHAPWEGCDSQGSSSTHRRRSFNSRTLGRVRQKSRAIKDTSTPFQFTHPGKGATSLSRTRL